MDKFLVEKVKEKREFSGLPDSVVERALSLNKKDVKKARAFLRKYFGVFMTNKVLRGENEDVLKSHISSKKRDYELFYKKISEVSGNNFKSVIDFGCGMNGFSYSFMEKDFGKIKYCGIEATRQLCDLQNDFFKKNNFDAKVLWGNVLDFDMIKNVVLNLNSPRLILLLQTIDAMESVEPNSSKTFLLNLKNILSNEDIIVVSNPVKSISGKNNFKIQRRWLDEFIESNFNLVDRFELFDEFFLVAKLI